MNWYQQKRNLIHSFVSGLNKSDQEEWLVHRNACDKRLFFFVKEVGGYAKEAGGDASEIIHGPICDWWQDKSILFKYLFMPRKWLKTTLYTELDNIWEYLQNNEIRISIPSEKAEMASDWLGFIESQILTNERLRWLYPELSIITRNYTKTHPWSGLRCLLPREGVYAAPTISVIGIRGSSQGGHFDILGPDDVVGEKGYESLLVLEDACRWIDNMEELLIDNKSRIKGKGTHWGAGDYGIYIQKNYPQFEWRIVPALKDSSLKDTDNIKYIQNPNVGDDESNWPEMHPTEEYSEMKANPQKQIIFWAQHMNNPYKSNLMTKIDHEWLRWFHFEDRDDGKYIVCDEDKETFKLSEIPLYGMIDPGGFAETRLVKTGSRNAIVIGGQPIGSIKKFIVYTWAGRLKKPSEFLDEVFKAHENWHPRLWRCETIGAQEYIKRDIKEEAEKKNIRIALTSMDKTCKKDEKHDDIQALIPMTENGEIHLLRSMKDAISELISYPSGLTNDLADMIGKLNKYCWSRKPKSDLDRLNKKLDRQYWESRNSITGY